MSEIVHSEPAPAHEALLEVRNASERIVSGRIVPYGEQITVRGRPESFARGALADVKPSEVKLFDHHRQVIGKMLELEEREDGAYASFKIAATPKGDELLTLVTEGVVDSFSLGFIPGQVAPDGTHHRVKALPEVSLVTFGAYPGAKVLSVREKEDPMSDTTTATATEPTPLTADDIQALQTRQDEMFEMLNRVSAAIESGVETRSAPKPPKPLDWFRAQLAKNFDQDPKPMEALEKRWEEFKEYASERPDLLEGLQTRALADITGGETQAGDNTPPDDLSGLVVEEFLASQLVNVLDARRPLFRRLGSFPAVRSGYVRIPTITQHTKVDKRAGQKEEANSQKMIVTTSAFEAEWYDGAVDIALEVIRTAEVGVMELVWNDMLGVYAKRIESETVAKVEAGGLGFTYTGSPLTYTGQTAYKDFATAVATQAITVRENTDVNATKLGVPKDLWIALVAATDANDRRQFAPGDYSPGSTNLTAESLMLPGGIECFYVPGLTQAILFNEEAFRAVDYGPERVEAVNVAQMGRDLGVLGRAMWVPRIPSGVVVFGDDPQSS